MKKLINILFGLGILAGLGLTLSGTANNNKYQFFGGLATTMASTTGAVVAGSRIKYDNDDNHYNSKKRR